MYYYQPSGGYCGDPMPFYDEQQGVFRIYYLQEFRPNPEGTYHPIYAIETSDLVHYATLGEVLPTGSISDQDAALGTGSVIRCCNDNLYYFFYTGNRYYSDGECRQAVMCATSGDGVNWTKTDFRLDGTMGYYYRDDFRDPDVFIGEDGIYHMIVATGKDGRNVLAHFTSNDCREWTDRGVLMNTMWDRFYECPDIFKMGDWWYLVYSELHKEIRRVQYFKARTFEGLAACTADDAGLWPDNHEGYLDSRGFYAGKTATDGTNRYIWGWCPTRRNYDNTAVNNESGEPDWGGTLVAHRLIQHADGSLTLGEVPQIAGWFNSNVALPATSVNINEGQHQLFTPLTQQTHISFTLITGRADDKFGISVARDENTTVFYSFVVNPEGNSMRKVNFEQEGGIGFIPYIDGYFFTQPEDRTYHIDIYIDNNILVIYINDNVCYTNRVYRMLQHGWSINCYTGSVQVRGVRQQVYNKDISAFETIDSQPSTLNYQRAIVNGQLFITCGDKTYTITGTELR